MATMGRGKVLPYNQLNLKFKLTFFPSVFKCLYFIINLRDIHDKCFLSIFSLKMTQ